MLDITVLKTGRLDYSLQNLSSQLSSDHFLILLDIKNGSSQALPPKPIIKINWKTFPEIIVNTKLDLPTKIKNDVQIEGAIILLSHVIQEAFKQSTETSFRQTPKEIYQNKHPTKNLLKTQSLNALTKRQEPKCQNCDKLPKLLLWKISWHNTKKMNGLTSWET